MSGPPMVKSIDFGEAEARPVLGPAGNKSRSLELRRPILKIKSEKVIQSADFEEANGKESPVQLLSPEMTPEKIPSPVGLRKNASNVASILRQRQPNLSMNASCSSDASTDSTHSRASTGRINRRTTTSVPPFRRKQQCSWKGEKIERMEGSGKNVCSEGEGAGSDGSVYKKRCAWVTTNADPPYAEFHDEEWGLPVHDDRKLFELLGFSTALAELTWPVILSKRHIFRDVFLDFDPLAVSKLNDKKIVAPGSLACSLLSELKLRAIIENARQICKIIEEFGSFDRYIWGFVNYKPIVSNFRYPRQVPIKTSKADTISKDLVKRGFRGVGPTVIYSFMQVCGITNDHLINCFRYQECIAAGELNHKNEDIMSENEGITPEDFTKLELARDIVDLNLSR